MNVRQSFHQMKLKQQIEKKNIYLLVSFDVSQPAWPVALLMSPPAYHLTYIVAQLHERCHPPVQQPQHQSNDMMVLMPSAYYEWL